MFFCFGSAADFFFEVGRSWSGCSKLLVRRCLERGGVDGHLMGPESHNLVMLNSYQEGCRAPTIPFLESLIRDP